MFKRALYSIILCSSFIQVGFAQEPTPTATPEPTATATATPTPVTPAKLDFDGDGETDWTGIVRQSDNSENTMVHYAIQSDDSSIASAELGNHNNNDQAITADYDGDGIADVGVLITDDDEDVLTWKVIPTTTDTAATVNFGEPGDSALYGCDFDGDGADDLAVISGKTLTFRSWETDTTSTVRMVKRLSKYDCADIDGDGADEIIGAKNRRLRNGRKAWYFFAWNNTGTRILNTKFGSNVKGLISVDLDNNGTAEIGYFRRARSQNRLVFKTDNGTERMLVNRFNITNGGNISRGTFSSESGIILKATTGTFYQMSFVGRQQTAIDTSSLNTSNALYFVKDSGTYDTDAGSSGGGGGAGLSSVCPTVNGISHGILWKPDADASDSRNGKPVILFTGGNKPGKSSVKIYAANGTQIGSLGFKASSIPGVNGGAEHYFTGWSGGSGHYASQLANNARSAAGSTNIYVQGRGSLCIGPLNPTSRSGSI